MKGSLMRITPKELHENGKYEIIETVDYRNILWFVIKYIKANVLVMHFFYFFLILTVLVFIFFSTMMVVNYEMGFFPLLGRAVLYITLSMVPIIPLHELLHGLAFKLMGAGKLIFGANFKEMIFYVTANRFVLNKRQFFMLALTPFVIFSIALIALLLANDLYIQWIASLLLAFHTSCCIGDFGLMAYFSTHSKGLDLYTYDDVSTKTTYFFRKKQ